MRKVPPTYAPMPKMVTEQSGIDAQAELQLKGESSLGGSVNTRQVTTSVATVQRAIMNRHQQTRRQPPGLAPRLETRNRVAQITSSNQSPSTTSQSQAASPSHFGSPTPPFNTLPAIGNQNVVSSPRYSPEAQQLQRMRLQQATTASMGQQSGRVLDHDSADEPPESSYDNMSGYTMSPRSDLNQSSYQPFLGEHNMNNLLGKLTRLFPPSLYIRALFVLD